MDLKILETLKYNSNKLKKRYLFNDDPEKIDENIQQLPTQLRNKIYIMCMRNYWRKYIPLTAKIPSWYEHAIAQKKMLFDAMQENIHFMHLPCNTLEENKKYILGCQCSYCKDYGLDSESDDINAIYEYNHRDNMEDEYLKDKKYFTKVVVPTESPFDRWNARWRWISYINDEDNDEDELKLLMGMKVFNPGEDIYITNKNIIQGVPINFNVYTGGLLT